MKQWFTFFLAGASVIGLNAQTAINFSGESIHGENIDLFALTDDDKTVLLDFFFADCPPCNDMMPYIVDIHEEFGADGLDLRTIGVSDRDGAARITTFENLYGADWANLPGSIGDGIITTYAGTFFFSGFPTYSVVCPDRSITWDIWGGSYENVANDIRAAILECGARMATGIETLELGMDIQLLPNPAQESSTIRFTLDQTQSLQLAVYNMLGEQMQLQRFRDYSAGAHQIDLNVASWSEGQYLVVIQDINGKRSTQSLQVTH